jgi:hypothetical protein
MALGPADLIVDATDLANHQAGDEEMLLRQAQGKVRDYCGWHVAPRRNEDLVVDGDGSSLLHLPTMHVTEVAAVLVDDELLDPSKYRWSADGMLERRDGARWPAAFRSVKVTLEHGYDPVPDGLVAAILGYAARLGDSPAGRVREQVGQVGVGFTATGLPLTEAEKADLAPYRLTR